MDLCINCNCFENPYNQNPHFGENLTYTKFYLIVGWSLSLQDIQCYKMSDIETRLDLCREKLVALALMLGCDYDLTGVRGVGKEQAVKLLQSWPNGSYTLQRSQLFFCCKFA